MSTQKCLWDSSHVFDAPDGGQPRPLCPTCYHKTYVDLYKKVIPLNGFIENIKDCKRAYQYVAALDSYYKSNIVDLATSQSGKEEDEMPCLICGEIYPVRQGESWKFLCQKCFKQYYLKLKETRSLKEVKELIVKLKNTVEDSDELIEKIRNIVNEI